MNKILKLSMQLNNEIDQLDKQQTQEDIEAGFIEGQLAATKNIRNKLLDMAKEMD
jgi:hypothetical protein